MYICKYAKINSVYMRARAHLCGWVGVGECGYERVGLSGCGCGWGGVIDPRISSHLMHHASLNDACSYGQIQLRGCECVGGCGWRGWGC